MFGHKRPDLDSQTTPQDPSFSSVSSKGRWPSESDEQVETCLQAKMKQTKSIFVKA